MVDEAKMRQVGCSLEQHGFGTSVWEAHCHVLDFPFEDET